MQEYYVPLVKLQTVKEKDIPYGKKQICNPENVAAMAREVIGSADREFLLMWVSNYEKTLAFVDDLTDALIRVLGITSYFQRKWIRKAMETFYQKYEVFSVPQFIFHIENLYEDLLQGSGTKDDIDNVKRLLSRLAPYDRLFELGIRRGENSEKKGITILRMSGMSESEKNL